MSSRTESSRPYLVTVVAFALLFVIWTLRSLIILVGLAFVLAYLLEPLVAGLHRMPLPRGWRLPRAVAAGIVILGIGVAGGWALVLVLPRFGAEVGGFLQDVPANIQALLSHTREWAAARGLSPYVEPALDQLKLSGPELVQSVGKNMLGWAGQRIGGLGQLLGLALLPVLAFYLLAEAEAVQASALRFVPATAVPRVQRLFAAVDRALRSYVRGQTIVCLTMGVLVGSALALLGFPLALLLGVIVGVAELLPFIGFWIATLAIVLTGYGVNPALSLLGLAAYAVINNLVGLLITPRVMGRHLQMHPFLVTVSVLAGGQLLGPAGVMLALPGAAVIQSVVSELAPSRKAAEAKEAPAG
jgi:predicted PurR-regulated permease PerM